MSFFTAISFILSTFDPPAFTKVFIKSRECSAVSDNHGNYQKEQTPESRTPTRFSGVSLPYLSLNQVFDPLLNQQICKICCIATEHENAAAASQFLVFEGAKPQNHTGCKCYQTVDDKFGSKDNRNNKS